MIEYRDAITGYMIRRYTEGPERNSKLYFTSENFSVDDKYFYFNKNQTHGCNDGGCYRVEVATGEMTQVTDESYNGFALDREKNVAYVSKNGNEVYAVNLDDNSMTKLGELPKGGRLTSHFTAADTPPVGGELHITVFAGAVDHDFGIGADVIVAAVGVVGNFTGFSDSQS